LTSYQFEPMFRNDTHSTLIKEIKERMSERSEVMRLPIIHFAVNKVSLIELFRCDDACKRF